MAMVAVVAIVKVKATIAVVVAARVKIADIEVAAFDARSGV